MREAIFRRIREALAVARSREVKLGNPNGAAALREAVVQNADAFALDLAGVVAATRTEGHRTLRAIADEQIMRGMLTWRRRRWRVSNVRNLLARLHRVSTMGRKS